MKKLTLGLAICLLLVSTIGYAQERPFTGLFVAPESAKSKAVQPDTRMLLDGSLPINLSGDTIYRVNAQSIDAGIGMDLASYKNILVLRAEAAQSATGDGQFAGVGLFLNIPSFINLIGGNWNASYINPAIGVVPGYDFAGEGYDTGIVLSIIQVTF